jgi:hypothetical protein
LYAVANFYKLFTMKKHFITGLLATFAIAASAQSFTEWQNPEVNAVNRAPMHTNYFAYESADAARTRKRLLRGARSQRGMGCLSFMPSRMPGRAKRA